MKQTSHPLRMFLVVICVVITGTGCATAKKDYTKFYQADPHAILIVPPLNNSPEVTADTYFLATVGLPLAERGYYVFPVNMTKGLLIEAGLGDAGLVHKADPRRLGELFGADSILYISIDNWEAKYLLLQTTVKVSFTYIMKDASSGEEIWRHHQVMEYTPQTSDTGNPLANLIVATVQAAATKASPNYIPLAREANTSAFGTAGQGIPAGPHHPNYLKK